MDAIVLHSVEVTAQRLGVKEGALRKWLARRRIGYVRVGRRVLVPETEILRIISQGTVPAIEAEGRR